MASHGADQLIVQRLMSTRDVKAAQKALIASGFVVFLQFAFFLFIGVMLWAFYNGADPVKGLGLGNKDELFGYFIVNALPSGLSGFVIAGILAAALSSSLGALASSDGDGRLRTHPQDADDRRASACGTAGSGPWCGPVC